MPKIILQHESWCTDHNDEVGEPLCVSSFIGFGPPDDGEHATPGDRAGYLYLLQQGTDEAEVNLYYPTTHGMDSVFGIGVLRKLVAALEADPAGTIAALSAALTLHDQETNS